MRVVLLSSGMDVGGAERVVVALAAGLRARGHDVAIAAPAGPLDAELPGGIVRFVFPERGRSLLGAGANAVRLARFLRRFRPDVVHAHNPKMTILGAVAVRGVRAGRVRLVATFHGVATAEYGRAARMLRSADSVACVSLDLQRRLLALGVPPDRLQVVGNAVAPAGALDPRARIRLNSELGLGEGPVIAVVGRMVAQKAHDRFLRALPLVVAERPTVCALLVGEGPLRSQLEALAGALGVARVVRFTGIRADARDVIARSDVLIFSSDWEGLSIAALEALAAGVPVISTDVEGMRELLATGAGAIVEGWEPEDLARDILAVLGDPAALRRMSDEGRRLVAERYAPERMLDRYMALYTDD